MFYSIFLLVCFALGQVQHPSIVSRRPTFLKKQEREHQSKDITIRVHLG